LNAHKFKASFFKIGDVRLSSAWETLYGPPSKLKKNEYNLESTHHHHQEEKHERGNPRPSNV
jgi:hypothetical protein